MANEVAEKEHRIMKLMKMKNFDAASTRRVRHQGTRVYRCAAVQLPAYGEAQQANSTPC